MVELNQNIHDLTTAQLKSPRNRQINLTSLLSALPCPIFEIQNGSVQHSGETLQPGQSVRVSCDENFQLIGGARVVCVAGERTSTKPTCKREYCV